MNERKMAEILAGALQSTTRPGHGYQPSDAPYPQQIARAEIVLSGQPGDSCLICGNCNSGRTLDTNLWEHVIHGRQVTFWLCEADVRVYGEQGALRILEWTARALEGKAT